MAYAKPRPNREERRRRRRRRLVVAVAYVAVAFVVAWYFESQATTTMIFVRHADVDDPTAVAGDPPLNRAGRARAELLARYVQGIDVVAGVDAIYTAPTKRAQQTAAPLAERLGIDVGVGDPYDIAPFMEQVLRDHKGEIVLIVTDRNAIAPLIDELHGSKNLPEIAAGDYTNIYVVTIPWGGGAKVKTLRMLYGLEWKPPGVVASPAGASSGQ